MSAIRVILGMHSYPRLCWQVGRTPRTVPQRQGDGQERQADGTPDVGLFTQIRSSTLRMWQQMMKNDKN